MVITDEAFRACGRVLDRAAKFACSPQYETEFSKLALLSHCAAASSINCVAPFRFVILCHRSARLHRHPGHAVDMEIH